MPNTNGAGKRPIGGVEPPIGSSGELGEPAKQKSASVSVPLRMLLVDTHFFFRLGLRTLLSQNLYFQVIADVASGREALTAFAEIKPDVVIMGASLPDQDGIEVAQQMISTTCSTKLLMLCDQTSEEDVHRAFAAQVHGVLPKATDHSSLLEAINNIAAGRRYYPDSMRGLLRERASHAALSLRETEVLRCLAAGWSNKMITNHLRVTDATTKTYVTRLMQKLGVHDRTMAVMEGIRLGLIRPR